MKNYRIPIAIAAVSAVGASSIMMYEGYSSVAYQPLEGDVWTIGFGTTHGVKEGDTIDPVTAVVEFNKDLATVTKEIKTCLKGEIAPYEMDAFTSLAYNIGTTAFCSSTLVRKFNARDYQGACNEIRRWVYFKGRVVKGLVNRREQEYRVCIGE